MKLTNTPAKATLKIAVLIPSYNRESTITDTLQSLMSQNALNLVDAIFLADDGSQDSTIECAKNYWVSSTPLKVLSFPINVGIYGNKNRAITILKNEGIDWVLILHADDTAKTDWLDIMIARINECADNVASICSSWDNLLSDGEVVPGEDRPVDKPVTISGSVNAVRGTLHRGCWWHISGAAIRMKAMEMIGKFDPQYIQTGDLEWILRALDMNWSFEYIPRTLIIYRQHDKSVSSKSLYSDLDLREGMRLRQKYSRYLARRDILRLEMRTIVFAGRRMARSLVRRDPRKLAISTSTVLLAVRQGMTSYLGYKQDS